MVSIGTKYFIYMVELTWLNIIKMCLKAISMNVSNFYEMSVLIFLQILAANIPCYKHKTIVLVK
jgi:hypothetical protein